MQESMQFIEDHAPEVQAPQETAKPVKHYKLGENRGNRRIWLQGVCKQFAGWTLDTRYNIHYGAASVSIKPSPDGERKLAAPSKGGVIDINTAELTQWARSCYPGRNPVSYTAEMGEPGGAIIIRVSEYEEA